MPIPRLPVDEPSGTAPADEAPTARGPLSGIPLRLIATGGTFDKVYDPIQGRLGFDRTQLETIVAHARLAGPLAIEVPLLRDSLEMDDSHRATILARCRVAPERSIVVVHGTDTMVETARVLGAAGLDATIVLTGAMVPYTVAGSDASFNLGHAIGCARSLPPGVWVAMNGITHRWDAVRKNRAQGLFEPLPADSDLNVYKLYPKT
jgi:L-asparaginase